MFTGSCNSRIVRAGIVILHLIVFLLLTGSMHLFVCLDPSAISGLGSPQQEA